jgi:hypothetical protein
MTDRVRGEQELPFPAPTRGYDGPARVSVSLRITEQGVYTADLLLTRQGERSPRLILLGRGPLATPTMVGAVLALADEAQELAIWVERHRMLP